MGDFLCEVFKDYNFIKIVRIIFLCISSSFLIFISHIAIKKVFDIDLLKIKEDNKWVLFYWVIGCVATYLILNSLKIVEYNIQSIIVVCFTWNVLLKNTVESLNNKAKLDDSKMEIKSVINNIDFDNSFLEDFPDFDEQ